MALSHFDDSGSIPRALVASLCLAVAACGVEPPAGQSATSPRKDLSFHIVGEPGCMPCAKVPGADVAGLSGQTLHVKPAFIRAGDIESITMSNEGDPAVRFVFSARIKDRIFRVTQENQGKMVAAVSGGRVVHAATIAGPYSDKMQLDNVTVDEQRAMHAALVAP